MLMSLMLKDPGWKRPVSEVDTTGTGIIPLQGRIDFSCG
jgi:hypothetical protein